MMKLKRLLPCREGSSIHLVNVDVREEYANAFRTESYHEFWTRVVALGKRKSTTYKSLVSSTADRLPSYRLFAEHLLDPDQPTVIRILNLSRINNHPAHHALLSDYFLETADASFLCGRLLKDIDRIRVRYRSLKTTIDTLETVLFSSVNHLPYILAQLTEFSSSSNPFASSTSSSHQVHTLQAGCANLLKRLESSRDEARAKIRLINKIKSSSAIFLVAFTISVTTIATAHALALLVATPSLVAVSLELASFKKLVRLSAQLDAAAKGTYILNRDLDIISRLVARVNDELEHIRAVVGFWLQRREDRLQASTEVVRQLKQNHSSFSQQLDELEEHLYLCFMTINRVLQSAFAIGI
ncbi:UPF0496 protein At3g49070 isoform X2 [Diospyros lotus]|uniref:UPF0496 protein At3g49070 isoform X2 n=1 Tax=Diospyros lotus TaxID=55363 RepID=UPI002254023C|nr:UPF0496 protein At3g49070 isoform X2 [Diospyros lotus]